MEAPTETNSEMGEAEPSVPKAVIVGRVELPRHTWDDPVEGFFAADTIGGLMFVIEFALCGVCRMEGGAGAE